MTEAMPFLQKYDITFLRPPAIHAGLVKMSILDQDVSNEARESVERILDKIEDIIPELREQEMEFDFDMEFGQQEEMEIGG